MAIELEETKSAIWQHCLNASAQQPAPSPAAVRAIKRGFYTDDDPIMKLNKTPQEIDTDSFM